MSKILLLGDVQTALFPKNLIGTEEDETINLGIKNINVEKYHKFISKKVYKKIKNIDYIIFQIGMNDLLKYIKEKKKIRFFELIYNIKSILLKLEKLDSKLVVQPIYPTKNRQLNSIIEEFNYLLAKECYETNIEFLDIYDILRTFVERFIR